MKVNLTELSQQVYAANKAKGFWDKERDLGELFMLIISEAGEALEAHRKGRFADMVGYESMMKRGVIGFKTAFEGMIKDSFEDELSDIAIRTLDFIGRRGIPLNAGLRHCLAEDYATKSNNVGHQLLKLTDLCVNAFDYIEAGIAGDTLGDKEIGELYLIDLLTKTFAVAEKNNVDLMLHIELKLKYNLLRERLHGKGY